MGTNKTRVGARSQEEIKIQFLDQLELTGNISMSAKNAKVCRKSIYNWLDADAEFKANFSIAVKIGIDLLEDEAQRRAFHGVKKPVYQGGVRVGYVQEYSDTLLIFLLKGKKPEVYKDRFEHTGKDGTPLTSTPPIVNIYNSGPPLATSEDEIDAER